MKLSIHTIDGEGIIVPMCIYMVAYGLQFGPYFVDYIGVPPRQDEWIVFVVVLIIGLFLMGTSYTICETGVEVHRLFGLIRKRYKWEEFHYTGCYLEVEKEKAALHDPKDYVIFLKKRELRLDYDWYLHITSDCCFPCYPTLYLIIEALTGPFCKPLPFPVDAPPEKSNCGSSTLKKWHFACFGYALFCLTAAALTMCYEVLNIALHVCTWGIMLGYMVIYFRRKDRLQKMKEECFQRFFAYIKESGRILQ